MMVHWFELVTVAGAFLTSVYVLIAKDPRTGLPDKAIGVITAIIAAGLGYITGKNSKRTGESSGPRFGFFETAESSMGVNPLGQRSVDHNFRFKFDARCLLLENLVVPLSKPP